MEQLTSPITNPLMHVALGNVHLADLHAGDIIMREAIGGYHFVQVENKQRVTDGSAKGWLRIDYRYLTTAGDVKRGYFHGPDTDLAQRARSRS